MLSSAREDFLMRHRRGFFPRVAGVVIFFALTLALRNAEAQQTVAPVHGCSCFFLKTPVRSMFGGNCDELFHSGQIFVNKKNVVKAGWPEKMPDKPPSWTSKYGSFTFNLVGFQMPWAGMNEEGLVISTMYLPQTKLPAPDRRAPLSDSLWVQYILDTCATVDDVIAADSVVRISSGTSHYLVLDKKSNGLVVEFLDGKTVFHRGEDMPVTVLENRPYRDCVERWQARDSYFAHSRFAIMADAVGKSSKYADAHAPLAGDISAKLMPYSHDASHEQLQKAINNWNPSVPNENIAILLDALESFRYADGARVIPKD